jgi:hypothetical protein
VESALPAIFTDPISAGTVSHSKQLRRHAAIVRNSSPLNGSAPILFDPFTRAGHSLDT